MAFFCIFKKYSPDDLLFLIDLTQNLSSCTLAVNRIKHWLICIQISFHHLRFYPDMKKFRQFFPLSEYIFTQSGYMVCFGLQDGKVLTAFKAIIRDLFQVFRKPYGCQPYTVLKSTCSHNFQGSLFTEIHCFKACAHTESTHANSLQCSTPCHGILEYDIRQCTTAIKTVPADSLKRSVQHHPF